MRRTWILAAALTALSSAAAGEVKTASANGFEIEHRADLPVSPEQAYRALPEIARWWSDAHTYSGKAGNLSLDLRPGGCWCETLPGGGVEHMRVAYVDKGKAITLVGSLGPLLTQATSGVMQLRVEKSGTGSALVMTYRVAGFYNGGADKLAPVVDGVLREQVRRFAAHVAPPAR